MPRARVMTASVVPHRLRPPGDVVTVSTARRSLTASPRGPSMPTTPDRASRSGGPRRLAPRWWAAACILALAACAAPPADDSAPPDPAAGSGGTNAAAHLDAPYVVLISFDGFRHDYMELHDAPNFRRVAATGMRAERMIPAFPTKTFPTHYSVATGMYAENHGLVGNRYWDPDLEAGYDMGERAVVEDGSWYRGEPIWVTAETQGMVTASYFFVGSEADVAGVRPTHWRRYDGSVPNDVRVDQVLAWLAMAPEERPHVIALYFSDVDGAGHTYGPESDETGEAVGRVDAALGRLLDGIEALPHGHEVYVILTSDHGMLAAPAEKAEVLDPDRFPGVRVAETGPYASLFVEEGDSARMVAVRDSISAMLSHGAVYLREDVPEHLHYSADPRIGDLVVIMEPEWTVIPPNWLPARSTFTHGWDNLVPEMGAILLIRGPGIAPGQEWPAVESVHVYPFMTHVLGLTPNPDVDGRLDVLRPLLD